MTYWCLSFPSLPQFLSSITYHSENNQDLWRILSSKTSFRQTENHSRSWVRNSRDCWFIRSHWRRTRSGHRNIQLQLHMAGENTVQFDLKGQWNHKLYCVFLALLSWKSNKLYKMYEWHHHSHFSSHSCTLFMHSFNRVTVRPSLFSVVSSSHATVHLST